MLSLQTKNRIKEECSRKHEEIALTRLRLHNLEKQLDEYRNDICPHDEVNEVTNQCRICGITVVELR